MILCDRAFMISFCNAFVVSFGVNGLSLFGIRCELRVVENYVVVGKNERERFQLFEHLDAAAFVSCVYSPESQIILDV
jgi:hypothetical protein